MAVAVKNMTEATPARPPVRLPVASLLGAIYVLASIAVAFYVVPILWRQFVTSWMGEGIISDVLRLLAMLAVAAVLVVGGVRLAGPNPPRGLRAGIFVAFAGLLVIGLITDWIGFLIESWIYSTNMFGRQGDAIGATMTGVVGVLLAILAGRFFFSSNFEQRLVAFEEQGWFNATSYKRTQGQRVRRGTILGILVLAGCGVYSLVTHGALDTAPDWTVPMPFTASVRITAKTVGDQPDLKRDLDESPTKSLFRDRLALNDLNAEFRKHYVKIKDPGSSLDIKADQVITREELRRIEEKEKGEGKPPTTVEVVEAKGDLVYQQMTVLPLVKFTLPLLLGALCLWFAWRIVNLPTFADFLIATEAELNKVSWTTRRRLVQDTIVVLVTVILLTLFLLIVDAAWGKLLSWKYIGVLRLPQEKQTDRNKELPW